MAGQGEKQGADGKPQAEQAAAPRAAEIVFTDPLSRQTSDDTDTGWGESGDGRGLDWYLSQRPPHHGG